MKSKQVVASAMLVALIGCGAGSVQAGHDPGGRFSLPPDAGMDRGDFSVRMAKILKLSDAQQSQIKTILDAEKEQIKPYLDTLREKRKLLIQAGETATFDEAAVRELATALRQIETELTVSRIKTQSRINALLTTEQRELLQNLRPDMDHRPPPPPAGCFGE